MPKIKQISKVIVGALLYFALSIPVARADRRPVFLLNTKCVDTGVGNWSRNKEAVAIGKAVYTSLFYMGPGNESSSMTCKIMPDGYDNYFQTVTFGFGMRDNDRRSPGVTVNVYLDKRQAVSKTVKAGQKEFVVLNVYNVRDVSIETICTNKTNYCDRVYFYEASLEPIPEPPKPKK